MKFILYSEKKDIPPNATILKSRVQYSIKEDEKEIRNIKPG